MSEDSSKDEAEISVPSNFKSCTIQDRKIVLWQPKRVKPKMMGEYYDEPEGVKKTDLANLDEDPRPIYIATNLTLEEEELLISTLKDSSKSTMMFLNGVTKT